MFSCTCANSYFTKKITKYNCIRRRHYVTCSIKANISSSIKVVTIGERMLLYNYLNLLLFHSSTEPQSKRCNDVTMPSNNNYTLDRCRTANLISCNRDMLIFLYARQTLGAYYCTFSFEFCLYYVTWSFRMKPRYRLISEANGNSSFSWSQFPFIGV